MDQLTNAQIEKQDSVDNAIHQMIENVLGRKVEWDIEPIAEIRDIIISFFCADDKEEMEFYPYLEM